MKTEAKIKELIEKNRIIIFMKGEKNFPQCGFSMQAIEILNLLDADYQSYNILKDEQLRQDLKLYSNWPTYPQLYIEKELIGGIDIMKEMLAAGELEELIHSNGS